MQNGILYTRRGVDSHLLSGIAGFTWQDIVLSIIDVAIVSYLFYRVFVLIRGTRAVQLLKGVAVLFILVSLTQLFRLYTINYLLVSVRNMLVVALPILFWPEFRRALEQLGRGSLFYRSFFDIGEVLQPRSLMKWSRLPSTWRLYIPAPL